MCLDLYFNVGAEICNNSDKIMKLSSEAQNLKYRSCPFSMSWVFAYPLLSLYLMLGITSIFGLKKHQLNRDYSLHSHQMTCYQVSPIPCLLEKLIKIFTLNRDN